MGSLRDGVLTDSAAAICSARNDTGCDGFVGLFGRVGRVVLGFNCGVSCDKRRGHQVKPDAKYGGGFWVAIRYENVTLWLVCTKMSRFVLGAFGGKAL